jgi:hypothetical protein
VPTALPTCCPVGHFRAAEDADCESIPEDTACPSGQYRLTDDAECEAIPEDNACPSGQYRSTDDGECEAIPEDTACPDVNFEDSVRNHSLILAILVTVVICGCCVCGTMLGSSRSAVRNLKRDEKVRMEARTEMVQQHATAATIVAAAAATHNAHTGTSQQRPVAPVTNAHTGSSFV